MQVINFGNNFSNASRWLRVVLNNTFEVAGKNVAKVVVNQTNRKQTKQGTGNGSNCPQMSLVAHTNLRTQTAKQTKVRREKN